MKVIYNIAITELKMLFYSPIAWLMLIIFSVQCGVFFSNEISNILEVQALGRNFPFLTDYFFNNPVRGGLLRNIQNSLYLYIPLLTMGLMSKEVSGGSIKLLFSSPVSETQIILGKYLSIIIFSFSFILVLFLYSIGGIFIIKDIDIPHLLTGLLGTYLMICTYAAIGILVSSMTSYPIVAAIGTLIILTALNYVGLFWQDIEYVRDISYWLSIRGRSLLFVSGLICSEDVLYFIIVPILFLSLSVLRLYGKRKQLSTGVKGTQYLSLCLIVMTLGYISSRPQLKFHYDSTETKRMTLTPNSQEIMEKLDGDASITFYGNIFGDYFSFALPGSQNSNIERFSRYIRFKPEMKIKSVTYYHELLPPAAFQRLQRQMPGLSTQDMAMSFSENSGYDFKKLLSPDEIDKLIDLSGEKYNYVCGLSGKNSVSFLRMYNDMRRVPSEKEISAAFKRLVISPAVVGFLTGHDERSIDKVGDGDYFMFANDRTSRNALINNGFDCKTISFSSDGKIPEEIEILVIADPRKSFTEAEKDEIFRYVDSGKDLIILGSAYSKEVLAPITEPLGIKFLEGRLTQHTEAGKSTQLISGLIHDDAAELALEFNQIKYDRSSALSIPNTVGLEYIGTDEFDTTPVLVSDPALCWNELETTFSAPKAQPESSAIEKIANTNSGKGRLGLLNHTPQLKDYEEEAPVFNPELERKDAYPIVYALSRTVDSQEQKIFVSGNADCFSNIELLRNNAYQSTLAGNNALLLGTFRWITDGQYPVDASRPDGSDNLVYLKSDNMPTVNILLAIIPLLTLILGIIILIRRKAK